MRREGSRQSMMKSSRNLPRRLRESVWIVYITVVLCKWQSQLYALTKGEAEMAIKPELVDELLKDCNSPDDLLGQDGLLQQLTKALVERALQGELTHHLGYDKHSPEGNNTGNSRNGSSPKTVKGKRGQLQIDAPRDRSGEFEPQLIKKHQTRFDGLDDKIISLYARGMTTREIQGHLEEIYGVEVSPTLMSC